MFNITKSGSSHLITSNDNSQFPWKDGKMSIPMNSVTYVIDESDYIAFRSISNNDILFTALIDEIQIEGESVTKDTIIEKFDAVANGSTGGSATHKLTIDEMPAHTHEIGSVYPFTAGGNLPFLPYTNTATKYNDWGTHTRGGDKAHNNMPPYLVVYMWKRTG